MSRDQTTMCNTEGVVWQPNREFPPDTTPMHNMLRCIALILAKGCRVGIRSHLWKWEFDPFRHSVSWPDCREDLCSFCLYWGRSCINRHTGNRPSLSEEPLRRGPGPMARFPTLRYRPERYRHLDRNNALWNPFHIFRRKQTQLCWF